MRIDVEREKKLQVPLHHLGGLVCFGNVMVSPALMHRLADEGKSLVLLDDSGRFKARLEGPVSGNILLRQAQHKQADDAVFMLNDKGRRAVVTAWQERKQEEITHPLTESKLPFALLPFVQARFIARTLRGEMESYLPFVAR